MPADEGGLVSTNRERIFNLPGVVTAILSVLIGVQLLVDVLPETAVARLFNAFAFIPARTTYLFAPQTVLDSLAAAPDEASETALLGAHDASALWTLVTYALLHANWTHVLVNGVTLAAFGAPLARRFRPGRFLAFFVTCVIAGALVHLLTHPIDFAPVVGASAGISGVMAAVARFAFQPGAPLGEAVGREDRARVPGFGDSRRATIFVLTWFGLNLVFGLFPEAAGSSGAIAWEAHMGGFLVGLILFGLFDPKR